MIKRSKFGKLDYVKLYKNYVKYLNIPLHIQFKTIFVLFLYNYTF